MRLAVRIALWVLLLGGSAATGAFIAARSNPLPPQVEGGLSPTPADTTTPTPKPERWAVAMRSTSFHQLYVGGTCETDWSTSLRLAVAHDGSVSGTGTARLTSRGAPCPFPVAQVEIRQFALRATGQIRGGSVHLRLTEVSHRPSAGAEDLGGFRKTVLSGEIASALLVHLTGAGGTSGSGTLTLSIPGPDRDTFGSTNAIRLRCETC